MPDRWPAAAARARRAPRGSGAPAHGAQQGGNSMISPQMKEALEFFKQNGYHVIESVLSSDEVASVRDGLGDGGGSDQNLLRRTDAADHLLYHPKVRARWPLSSRDPSRAPPHHLI
eukprot:SAG31_NODE_4820_length_2931_cov_2.018008_1_plen_116_part_00